MVLKMEFKDALKKLIDTEKIASVFCNPDDSYKASVGFVAAVSEDYFILRGVSVFGAADGYLLRRYDTIFRMDVNCEYERRLMLLYGKLKEAHAPFTPSFDDLLVSFFDYARCGRFVVGVGIRDYSEKSIFAFVKEVDVENQMLLFSEVNDDGRETGGEFYVLFDAVMRASVGSCEEIKLQMLNEAGL